ncbi:hypothetical protein Taro_041998 [Colocasia esculenta]|uniref:Uncharacterized protein n=1 Tax=Colocasia esculenta TaxID=4460 RepID=A0A843WCU4_COLES|nr:hypothetical protein [Colocasia esculenta]
MRVATGSTDRAARSRRPGLSRSDHDGTFCRDAPVNAAYRAITFTGSVPESDKESTTLVVFEVWVTRAFFFPHFLLSSSPTFTLVPLDYFRQSTGARGKAVMRAAAADQAGSDGLERSVRGAFLGFRRDSSVLDINSRLESRGAFFFPHFLLSSSPTFALVPLDYFRRSTRARGKAVMRTAAADQAGSDGLERGVRGAFLGFRRDSRFFGSLIAFLRYPKLNLLRRPAGGRRRKEPAPHIPLLLYG